MLPKMRKFRVLFVVVLLLWISTIPAFAAVLVLHSYSSTLSWTSAQERGILDVIDDGIGGREIHLEFMDTKRTFGSEYFRRYAALLEEKYSAGAIDYIIATDNYALEFMRQYRDELFGEVPLIFSGVNFYKPELSEGLAKVTGIAEVLDYGALFEMIKRFHPDLDRVVVVHDGTVTAERNIARLLQLEPALEIPLYVHSDSSYESIVALAETLTPREPLFLISSIRDRGGDFMEFESAAEVLRNRTAAPLYGAWDFFLGHGVVGGPLIDGEAHGRQAGALLLSLEIGASADSIPVSSEPITINAFDFNELKRFNISSRLLPPDAVVINRPLPILREYPLVVSLGATTVAILLLLLLLLMVNMRRRKATEHRLTIALSEKTNLLREVHHRVKNNLQIVSSLMNIQQDRFDDPENALVLQECENRVQSIALVHEQLYHGSGEGVVAIKPYITDLIGRIGDSYLQFGGVPEVVVDVDETRLSVDQTLLLGLLLNETVSNSYKHAFPGESWHAPERAERPLVEVLLTVEGGEVRLTVRDNGVGFAVPQELAAAESMGLQLIGSLTEQLGGSVSVDGTDGTVVAIRFEHAA